MFYVAVATACVWDVMGIAVSAEFEPQRKEEHKYELPVRKHHIEDLEENVSATFFFSLYTKKIAKTPLIFLPV